jgi:exodeoxyribonuclease V beta subunit
MKPLNLASIGISGCNLIEASAGTGKTWTIAALYILLLLEKELRPEQILVVTYTKAATAELRERIRRRIVTTLDLYTSGRAAADDDLERLLLGDRPQNGERAIKLLTRALYSFDDAAIFTIHGFCQRALLENTFESGSLFGSDMISDQSAIVKQVCDDFWRSRVLSANDDFTEQLVAAGYTPEKLLKPLAGHYQNPGLVIIPQADNTPMEPLLVERNSIFGEVCSLWSRDCDVIISQINQARLNQQGYKPAQIESACGFMNTWTAAGNAALPNSKLDMFTTRKIAAKVTATSSFTPDHPFYDLCQQLSDVLDAIDTAFQNRIIVCRTELKKWLEQELSRKKKQLNQRAFDDLLLDLHLALEAAGGASLAVKLRQRYQAAMIDEFQDTDPLQWQIFKKIGDEQDYPLFLIGDPKQAIYSFRGADVFAYLNAGKNVAAHNMHTLETNFRSDAALVKAVSRLFSCAEPFLCREIPFHPVHSGRSAHERLLVDGIADEQPFKIWIYPRGDETKAEVKVAATRGIVTAVAGEISRLLEPGRVTLTSSGHARHLKPGDIAVLVKAHKQADRVQEALSALGIPSVQQGSSTIFETREAMDMLRILRAVAEPHREALVREALLTATMSLDALQISSYLETAGEHPEWEAWLLRFRNLRAAVEAGGVVALVSRLLGSCGVRAKVLALFGGERRLTNILHCAELLHQFEREQGKSLTGLISWLERKIITPGKDDAALLRLESDENAVMLSTIHASKGLQYPVVFVPFAWDTNSGKNDRALFHNDGGDLVLDLAEEETSVQQAEAERRAEAARLLYVALTRAEFRCYTVHGAINGAVDAPLFRLLQGGLTAKSDKDFVKTADREILEKVRRQTNEGTSGIFAEMMPVAEAAQPYRTTVPDVTAYSCRALGHPPRDDWHVASFSAMTSGAAHAAFEPHDRDATQSDTPAVPPGQEPPAGDFSIFDFPRGAKAGTCLHEIFERLDFSALDHGNITAIAAASLAGNGFHSHWLPAVGNMVKDVAAAGIIPDDPAFSLSRLKKGDWHTEMEFFLPIRQLAPEILRALFAGVLDGDQCGDFYEVLNRLSFRQSRGMLQGFIDLVFTHEGRYYILDWKSNHLGMKRSGYDREAMHESMCRSAYILQYHLYTLALDRLLKLRLPDYDYEKHFGGAIYLYLRGISPDSGVNGIYYGRPSPEFIQRAADLMLD